MRAVRTARTLPPDVQDGIARIVPTFAGDDAPADDLTTAEVESLAESRDQARRGEVSPDADVAAVRAKHGL